MCHDANDGVPGYVDHGPVAIGRDIHLTAPEGTSFLAYSARSTRPNGAGIVLLPSANGLVPFFKELCLRFASIGYDTVGVDYYGRTAGLTTRVDDVKIHPEHMPQVRPELVDIDVATARGFLRSPEGGGVGPVGIVGFCFAGALSWQQARTDVAGCVGFYGCAEDLRTAVPDLSTLRAPLLLLIAGADKVYPPDDVRRLDQELANAGVTRKTVYFDDAPHGFFRLGEWQQACDRAWDEVLRFLADCTGVSANSTARRSLRHDE